MTLTDWVIFWVALVIVPMCTLIFLAHNIFRDAQHASRGRRPTAQPKSNPPNTGITSLSEQWVAVDQRYHEQAEADVPPAFVRAFSESYQGVSSGTSGEDESDREYQYRAEHDAQPAPPS